MQAAIFEQFGRAAEVLQVVEQGDPEPGPGEVVVRMEAAPINPADLMLIAGKYGVRPELPHVPGLEGVGRIEAVGEGVTNVQVGRLVMPLPSSTWQERLRVKAAEVLPLPDGIDIEQAAMLKVNPATAELLLSSVVDLQPGEWVVQNAANSAVGRFLVQLAKRRGLKTLNIVRRGSALPPLEALGADAVLVDDVNDAEDLAERAKQATGGAEIRLAVDAVAGPATLALAATLTRGGTVANYGVLSKQPCQMNPVDLIFRGLQLRGFWLSAWAETADPVEVQQLYHRLATMMAEGDLQTEVAARYPLAEVRDAGRHALQPHRDGKILLKL